VGLKFHEVQSQGLGIVPFIAVRPLVYDGLHVTANPLTLESGQRADGLLLRRGHRRGAAPNNGRRLLDERSFQRTDCLRFLGSDQGEAALAQAASHHAVK
jgi:hypothetical protein